MKKRNLKCNCIRCREIGHREEKTGKFEIKVEKYNASDGEEFFISYEDENETVAGILRLRIPSNPFRKELKNSTVVRELHVYGPEVEIGSEGSIQHTGLGEKLLEKTEKITKENGFNKISIISGVGVREYYRKFGYSLNGPYMSKVL